MVLSAVCGPQRKMTLFPGDDGETERESPYLQTLSVKGRTGNMVTGQGSVEDAGLLLAEVEKELSE